MSDNLIFLLNKLSYQIVTATLNRKKNIENKKIEESYFKKCVERLRQKGCDVLLNKSLNEPPSDPCITDYGGNWSPLTLLFDYAKELEEKKAIKYSDMLSTSIKCLQEREYDCINDMLKFLLILKKPSHDFANQNNCSLISQSNLVLHSMDSFCNLVDESIPSSNECLSGKICYRKGIKYEESWTKTFDSKFQTLGEYSKKNLLSADRVSFDSLYSATSLNSQSQSTFVFTDFCFEKNYHSEKNLFDLKRNYSCDIPGLDDFVEVPILHKLPNLVCNSKGTSKTSYFDKSGDKIKRKLDLLKEEEQTIGNIENSKLDQVFLNREVEKKLSKIELKRNSNCAHSLAILYEKNFKSYDSSVSSNDSLHIRDKWKNKLEKNSQIRNAVDNSKEIVLGLWEHDKALIKEFRPELASTLPTLRMITITDFVEDVKYLLTAINSGSFQYSTENKCFEMVYGTCLGDCTPESLFHFSKEFIEIGNLYRLLSAYATENGKSNLEICTTISQAFWRSIYDYLELHYTLVLEIPNDVNLMMLKSSVNEIHEMIVTMSNICKVTQNKPLPEGGALLTYLFQISEKLNRRTVKNLVLGTLQNCCTIYFRCILQPWMFKGHLDMQNNEFFIFCNRQKINMKSRTYYGSFYIDYDKVPCFLIGLEESIFNCGKSIHFLKLFNMEDKFCQILEKSNYPRMQLCLSEAKLEKLKGNFEKYKNHVIETCGESFSIKKYREEEKNKEIRYLEYIKDFKAKQGEERELEKLRKLENSKKHKELQNKLLNEEVNRMLAEKQKKKLIEAAAIKKLEEKIARAADKEREIFNQEKSKIINYYNEMFKNLDFKIKEIQKRKQYFQKKSADVSSNINLNDNIMDVLNDNIVGYKLTDTNKRSTSLLEVKSLDYNSNAINDGNNTNPCSDESLAIGIVSLGDDDASFDENSNVNSVMSYETAVTINENDIVEKGNFFNNNNNNKDDTWRSVSAQNIAADEALKNKIKVLKSEYGISSKFENSTSDSKKAKEIPPDSKVNFKSDEIPKINSDYSILNCGSDLILMKPVPSLTEIVIQKEDFSKKESELADTEPNIKESKSYLLKETYNYQEVGLEKKQECLNLKDVLEGEQLENSDVKMSNSNSLFSFSTQTNEGLSEDNISAQSPSELNEISTQNCRSALSHYVLNPLYKNALLKDSVISSQRLTYEEVFQNLHQIQMEKHSCIDLSKFQRYLKKSIAIPLTVQEKLAGDAILNRILVGENFLSHLRSLRAFLFFCDGDFARSFIHGTFQSLAKCAEAHEFFERSNLSNIVNEALNYTVQDYESNSQNLSFKIVKMPPFLNHSSHDVLAPFELSYKVGWPLNIILTEKALDKYKSIFRFLMKLKRINWVLNETFLFLSSSCKGKKTNARVLISSPHYHKIQIYRYAMTQVTITLDEYIFSNGIQLPWISFLKDLDTTENIDQLYYKHVKYVKEILTRCFLSNNSKELLHGIYNLIELSLKFHYTAMSTSFTVVDGKYEHPKFEVLKATFNEFCSVVKIFIRTLKEKIASNRISKSHYVLIEKFDLKLV